MVKVERARGDQVDAIAQVADDVMRPWRVPGGGMAARFPHLFAPGNAENLYFVADDQGRPVSVAAVMRRDVVVEGARLSSASLGAVSTLPEHRGQGHASAIVNRVIADLEKDRVSLLFVSGRRDLYARAGLVEAGNLLEAFWDPLVPGGDGGDGGDEREDRGGHLEALGPDFQIVPVTYGTSTTPELLSLYGHEPVRFHRSVAYMADHLPALNFPRRDFRHRVFSYLEEGEVRAYGITAESPNEPTVLGVMEWAGSRVGVIRILKQACQLLGRPKARLWMQPLDATMRTLVLATGGRLRPEPNLGTIRLIHVQAFLRQSAAWREERGIALRVSKRGAAFRIRRRRDGVDDVWTVKGVGALTKWCFGPAPEGLGMPLPYAGDLNYV